ncbi:hypothetical protein F5878DRAFT_689322 [Lentinula raphanica]|uniref:Uncharacterized protein n=1 Tax=Lentinula raphanica TaxID=153919 RepID=A0AA38P4V3_9AGAR|nr:hypothetical protein F5878DRAFT_689322 [Lentinula raphanica]
MSCMMLPEEILHAIVQFLAHNPNLIELINFDEFAFHFFSPMSRYELDSSRKLELQNVCVNIAFSACIRTLVISDSTLEAWQDPSIVESYDGPSPGPIATEFAMIWCTSRIAKLVPSIEAFYIEEEKPVNERGAGWSIWGWIFVHNMQSNRSIQLQVIPPHMRSGWHPKAFQSTPLKYHNYQRTFFV